MKHIKKIKIDIDKRNFEVIPSVQYDSNTRFLHINLTNGSIPFDLTGCSVKISGTKPDGTAIFNNCTIINAKEGFIEVELTEQMNAVSGTLKCELKIYSANGVLTTKQFYIDITSSITSKEITSSNEFKALTEALVTVKRIEDLEQLLLNKFPTNYVKPTLNMSCNKGTKLELGSIINPTISARFTQNDAGAITKYKLLKGTTTVQETSVILDHTESFKLTGDVKYTAEVSYAAGAIKNDSLGRPNSQGQIQAGTITNSITITAARAAWGFVSDSGNAPTADIIRAATVTGVGLQEGSTIRAVANAGSTRTIIFAYPAALRDCSKIRYEESGDDNNKTAFKQVKVSIPDASGANSIEYRVYYYTAAVAFNNTATFTLTI